MKTRLLVLVVALCAAQFAAAQGNNQRIDTRRATSGTPEVSGVTGTCKNSGTRDIVIKVANLDPSLLNNVKVEAHPPFTVVSAKASGGEIHVTVKGEPPTGAAAQYAASAPGSDRCDFTVKFFKGAGDKYAASELYASTKAEQSDAYLEAQKKQQQQVAQQQAQIQAAQEQMKKAQPALEAQQKGAVGSKWTVHWASGQTETWSFSGMDNMTHMANFKGPSGDVKIMFAGMYYTIMQGQCAMMAQPEGTGKVSGKTMGGKCSSSGAFTATIE